jgi:antitoxin YefM
MSVTTTYSKARAELASLLDKVCDDREVVIIQRRGRDDVAMISAAELSSLRETAHLLRSPRNATRLFAALEDVAAGRGKRLTPAQLRAEVGLGKDE